MNISNKFDAIELDVYRCNSTLIIQPANFRYTDRTQLHQIFRYKSNIAKIVETDIYRIVGDICNARSYSLFHNLGRRVFLEVIITYLNEQEPGNKINDLNRISPNIDTSKEELKTSTNLSIGIARAGI